METMIAIRRWAGAVNVTAKNDPSHTYVGLRVRKGYWRIVDFGEFDRQRLEVDSQLFQNFKVVMDWCHGAMVKGEVA